MTVIAFVLLLAIPVLMVAKKTPVTVVLVAIWGLFAGMTPAGLQVAHALNHLGASVLYMA